MRQSAGERGIVVVSCCHQSNFLKDCMDFQRVPLGPWLPDLPAIENPGCTEAKDAIPENGYFRSLPSLLSATEAITPVPQTGFWAETSDGTRFTFLGTTDGLFRSVNADGSWDDVSNGDMSSATNWRFAQFGDFVLAVAAGFAPQAYDLTGPPASTTFQDLAGSPPTAVDVAVVRDFVFLVQPDGALDRVQWAGFNSSTLWTRSILNQADFNEFQGRIGKVQRVVPGEFALVICEHSIFRMDYVGPPTIFQVNEIDRGRGTPAPDSVCWTGELTFFYAHDGFYMHDGSQAIPIGHNKVDNFFASNVTGAAIASMRGAVDRSQKLVFWVYSGGATDDGVFNRALIYNWASGTWARAEFECTGIFENIDAGFSLDALDNILANIDEDSINVDSNDFQGGAIQLGVLTTDKSMSTFSGDPVTAVFESREFSSPDVRTFVDAVAPEADGTNTRFSAQLLHRVLSYGDPTVTTARTPNQRTGEIHFRVNARYFRVRINVPFGFSHVRGFKLRLRRAGRN